MKRRPKPNKSIISFLSRSYLFFTLLVLAGFILVLFLSIWLSSSAQKVMLFNSVNKNLTAYTKQLERENYQAVPAEKIIGTKGYFLIVKPSGELIYSSKPSIKSGFSPDELTVMLPASTDKSSGKIWIPTLETYRDASHKKIYNFRKEYVRYKRFMGGIIMEKKVKEEYLILNEEGQVLSTNLPQAPKRFSQSALEIILSRTNYNPEKVGGSQSDYLYKYEFRTAKGEKQVMVMIGSAQYYHEEAQRTSFIFFSVMMGSFLLVYFLITLGMAFHIRRRIQLPIQKLGKAIVGLADGNRRETLDYVGPSEFTSIVNSVNGVARDLADSEDKRQLLEAERRKLLTDISHDLKTPVTVIQGYIRAINDGLITEEERAQYLQIIYQKSDKLTELINSFHEFSKIDHPDFVLKLEETDLADFIRDYAAEHYAEFELGGFNIELDISEQEVPYAVDTVQFERVLDNFFANFFRYNPKGSTLYIKLERQPAIIRITIANNGSELSEETAERLFQPFVTGDSARTAVLGSGLGLAIVQRIIEEHGGMVSLQNPPVPPYKTMFLISLPLQNPEE